MCIFTLMEVKAGCSSLAFSTWSFSSFVFVDNHKRLSLEISGNHECGPRFLLGWLVVFLSLLGFNLGFHLMLSFVPKRRQSHFLFWLAQFCGLVYGFHEEEHLSFGKYLDFWTTFGLWTILPLLLFLFGPCIHFMWTWNGPRFNLFCLCLFSLEVHLINGLPY